MNTRAVITTAKIAKQNVFPRSSSDSSSAHDDENFSSGNRFPMELNFVNWNLAI